MRKEKTLGLDKKKVTAVGRSLTVLDSTFGVDSFSEIESIPNVEPKIVSDVPTAVTLFLSSPSVFSFLNYALHLSVYDLCDK